MSVQDARLCFRRGRGDGFLIPLVDDEGCGRVISPVICASPVMCAAAAGPSLVLRQLVLLLELVQRRRVEEIALKPHVLSALLATRPARRA